MLIACSDSLVILLLANTLTIADFNAGRLRRPYHLSINVKNIKIFLVFCYIGLGSSE